MKYTVISRELIKSLKLSVFTETDYYGFAGVNSPIPLIAESDDEGILMIIDGGCAELYAYDGDGNFECVDTCEDINDLPVKTKKQIAIEAQLDELEESMVQTQYAINTLKEELFKLPS